MKSLTLSFAAAIAAIFMLSAPATAQAGDVGFSIRIGDRHSGVSVQIGSRNDCRSGHSRGCSHDRRHQDHGRYPDYRIPDHRYPDRNCDRGHVHNGCHQPRYEWVQVSVQVPVYSYRNVRYWDGCRWRYSRQRYVSGYRWEQQWVQQQVNWSDQHNCYGYYRNGSFVRVNIAIRR